MKSGQYKGQVKKDPLDKEKGEREEKREDESNWGVKLSPVKRGCVLRCDGKIISVGFTRAVGQWWSFPRFKQGFFLEKKWDTKHHHYRAK